MAEETELVNIGGLFRNTSKKGEHMDKFIGGFYTDNMEHPFC